MEFTSYLNAGYPLLLIATQEEERAISTLSNLASSYNCFQWDLVTGLRKCNNELIESVESPNEALRYIKSLSDESVIFMKDFHRYFKDLETCRLVKSLIPELKAKNKHIVFLTPVIDIPIELEKDITIIDFPLPSINELEALAETITAENGLDIEIDKKAIFAARGLTMFEAENAFARSLIQTKTYDREILEAEKLQVVKKSGLMEIYPPVPIDQVGGLEPLKKYIKSRMRGFSDSSLPAPKGILLAGLPGSGKSLTAKAIASVLGMPLIRLDLGTLKGGLVGQSEENMKRACNMIDAISPCVVWLDK